MLHAAELKLSSRSGADRECTYSFCRRASGTEQPSATLPGSQNVCQVNILSISIHDARGAQSRAHSQRASCTSLAVIRQALILTLQGPCALHSQPHDTCKKRPGLGLLSNGPCSGCGSRGHLRLVLSPWQLQMPQHMFSCNACAAHIPQQTPETNKEHHRAWDVHTTRCCRAMHTTLLLINPRWMATNSGVHHVQTRSLQDMLINCDCSHTPRIPTHPSHIFPMRTQYTGQTLYVDYAAYQPPEKQTTTTNRPTNMQQSLLQTSGLQQGSAGTLLKAACAVFERFHAAAALLTTNNQYL